MRAGISMADADRTELGLYLKVLEHMSREDKERQTESDPRSGRAKQVIELKRGYASDFFG